MFFIPWLVGLTEYSAGIGLQPALAGLSSSLSLHGSDQELER